MVSSNVAKINIPKWLILIFILMKDPVLYLSIFCFNLLCLILGFADLDVLTQIITENYNYWKLECQKEENSNAAEEVTSSNSSINKKDTADEQLNTSSSLKKEATPSNENITLTLEDTSLSKKENEENGCEVNKAA